MIKINTLDYSNIYICSDLHVRHDREFLYQPRGCKNVNEHRVMILTKINERVKSDDLIIHLGDFTLNSTYQQMIDDLLSINCNNIMFIIGNHDNRVSSMFDRMLNTLDNNGRVVKLSSSEKTLFNDKNLINLGKFTEVEILDHPKGDIGKKAIRTLVTLCHFPLEIWNKSNRNNSYHLMGHSHGNFARTGIDYTGSGKRFDVGVESALRYSDGESVLFNWCDIHDIMRYKPICASLDHH